MSSLKIVSGRAGSGKSEYITEEAIKTSGNSKNAIIIVPEQYTHEREMQVMSKTGYICESLNVTSFNRLAYRIIADSGIKRKRADMTAKAMLLSRALSKCRRELRYYKKAEEKTGYIELFLDAISEFKKGQIMPETLAVAANNADSLLSLRLSDLSIIYGEYNKLLNEKMSDADDDITLLSSLCFGNEYIKNSTIYIDEFFGFTQNELFCIESMLAAGADVVVSLCMPNGADSNGVFSSVVKTKSMLLKCAESAGANISFEHTLSDAKRFLSPELSALERAMSGEIFEYDGDVKDITLTVLRNRYDEVTSVATKIKQLVKDGMEYRDIAVIAGDYAGYSDIIKTTFSSYDIPVFCDTRKSFLDHPIVVYLFSVLDLLSGFTTDRVCAYMKSDFTDIDRESAARLENYALAAAINYNDWLDDERFLKKSASIFAYEETSGEEGLHQIEVKNQLLLPIIELKSKIKESKNVKDRVSALEAFFEKTDLEGKISEKAKLFEEEGKLNLADEYKEVYNIINETLDTLRETLGDEDTGLNVLSEILSAGFSQKSIGVIPKVYDSVAFGDINRSVIKNVKAMFLIGVNEGYFPSLLLPSEIFSDSDREYLTENGIAVARDSKAMIEATEFSLYESVNTAKEKLFVSYPIDNDGQGVRPASFVSKLKRIYKNLKLQSYLKEDTLPPELTVSSRAGAYSYVLMHIKNLDKNPLARTLCDELMKDNEYKEKLERAIKFSHYENKAGKLSPCAVSSLYGKNLTGSVSRFERFSACPFSFFIEYGLRAKERTVLKVAAPDVGSLLHEVVEKFSKVVRERELSFKTIKRCEQKEICDEIVDEMFDAMMIKKVFSEGRINALKTRLKSLVAKSVWAICEHIKRGEFEPTAFELSFDRNGDIEPVSITLPTGEEITMIGRIDRIDTFSHEGKLYLKIIDYKSGSKAYSLSDIFNKTTLQLSVYMIAATENAAGKLGDGETAFGGMFYFKLDDPVQEGMPDTEYDDEKALKGFKMSGLVADDTDVVSAIDSTVSSGWSMVIPVYKLKDGNISKSQSKSATIEQYEKLKSYVKKAVTEIGEQIVSGNIDISPIRNGDISPCSYCKYRAVCGFDSEIHKVRYAKKFSSDDEIWEEM